MQLLFYPLTQVNSHAMVFYIYLNVCYLLEASSTVII